MRKDNTPYTFLIVEDNPGDSMIVEDLLQDCFTNPSLFTARTFKETVQAVSAPGAFFDVVLLDLSLPDKFGVSLVAEIIELCAGTPVIILTGNSDIDFSISSISMGISDYLVKDELNGAVLYKSILYSLERNKMTTALQESEKRYMDLFSYSPQPSWVYDASTYQLVQVNKAALEHYGYSKEEFLQLSVLDLRYNKGIELAEDIVKQVRSSKSHFYKLGFQHVKKTGEQIEADLYSKLITIDGREYISVIAIDVTEKKKNEQNIIKAIIKTQEEERYEIGSELHDNVCQILAASNLYLHRIEEQLKEADKKWLELCRENIHLASLEIRNLSHRLAPVFFTDTTLEEAFRRLIDNFNINNSFACEFEFCKEIQSMAISQEIKLNLYRILQEQLKNILKYSKASTVKIAVLMQGAAIKMVVADNGQGFDPAITRGGIGLANMKRRAELFAGSFNLQAAPGMGCSVIVTIPVN